VLGEGESLIREPENGKPGDVSPAIRLASALAAGCMLCPMVGEPAVAADAPPAAPVTMSIVHRAGPVVRFPMYGPAELGDRELPHSEALEQTRDGSAATYAVTAPTTRVRTVPPPGWPGGPLGLPEYALMAHCSVLDPYAAATHRIARTLPPPGPGAASTGPALAS